MSFVMKNIHMSLDPKSIDEAIKAVKDFRKELEDRLSELAQYLVNYGQEVARMELIRMDAEFTGELIENGVHGIYFKDKHCGAVYTDKWYAVYVEFGTGMMHNGEQVHPLQSEFGYQRDVHEHGNNGWWYPAPWGWWIPDEGKHKGETMAWTVGMRNRPFMYNTLRELENIAKTKGIDFFKAL